MIAGLLSVSNEGPGLIPVFYLLLPAFYPLLYWLYRDLRLRRASAAIGNNLPLSNSEIASLGAAASVGSSLIHTAVIAPHHDDGFWIQLFFIVAALLQLTWAALVFRKPGVATWTTGIVLNAVLLLIWMQSRRDGLPFGPENHRQEAVGVPDTIAMVLELIIVFTAAALLQRRTRSISNLITGRLIAPVACIGICGAGMVGFALGGRH